MRKHRSHGPESDSAGSSDAKSPGKRTAVQMRYGGGANRPSQNVQEIAEKGIEGAPTALPHGEQIQRSFGQHDVSGIRAHVDEPAAGASAQIGAAAFATGNDVAFAGAPDLHTAAHEAAHVVQQRAGVSLAGGVGQDGDSYERHADAVADAVVAGHSAEELLGGMAGAAPKVQRKLVQLDGTSTAAAAAADTSALADDEFVLTRDPALAKSESLARFRNEVKGAVEPWGMVFAPASVRLATAADGAAVIALKWPGAWGSKPTSRDARYSSTPVEAKVACTAVHGLGGWSSVAAGDKTVIDSLIGGETNDVSKAARAHLRPTFAALKAKTPDEQANALKGIIGVKESAPEVVAEQVDVAPVTVALTGPTARAGFAFRGIVADAECWVATFSDGPSFEIVAPKAPTAGHHNHTVAEAADAARYLPKANRLVITQVLLNAVVNPDDAHWAVEYHRPDFHSYMTAGAAGVVTIYPNKTTNALPSANYMRGAMIHESGHTWSYKKWGSDTTAGKWVDWKNAMTADRLTTSGYAMSSIAEDVAETIQAYGSTKGTPKYDEYKAMVPKRFEILEREL